MLRADIKLTAHAPAVATLGHTTVKKLPTCHKIAPMSAVLLVLKLSKDRERSLGLCLCRQDRLFVSPDLRCLWQFLEPQAPVAAGLERMRKDTTMATIPPTRPKAPSTNGRTTTVIKGLNSKTRPKMMFKTPRMPMPHPPPWKARTRLAPPEIMAWIPRKMTYRRTEWYALVIHKSISRRSSPLQKVTMTTYARTSTRSSLGGSFCWKGSSPWSLGSSY